METLQLILPGHPLRNPTEYLVRRVYASQYGARVSIFPDVLAALVTPTGAPYCAAGLQIGLPDCFLETYLDDEIQNVFSAAIGDTVSRDDILEVTGLASIRIGASFTLLREIITYGRACDMRFGVFTLTRRLRRTMKAARISLIEFSPARKSRVSNPEDWGTYYDNDPWVCGLADRFLKGTGNRLNRARYQSDARLRVA